MTFIIALIIVILVGWLAKYVIALLTAPVGFLLIFAVGIDEEHPVGFRRPHLFIPMTIIANLYNSYVMTAWAAFVCTLLCFTFKITILVTHGFITSWALWLVGGRYHKWHVMRTLTHLLPIWPLLSRLSLLLFLLFGLLASTTYIGGG